jgi:hypothetical protein
MPKSSIAKRLIYYLLTGLLLLGLVEYVNIVQPFDTQTQINLSTRVNLAKSHIVNYPATSSKNSLTGKMLGEKTAIDLVWKLAQVQHKAREIEQLTHGSIHVTALVDSTPTINQPYYIVRVYENHPDKSTNPIYWFRVLNPSGGIEALDLVDNKYIPLDKWNPDGR